MRLRVEVGNRRRAEDEFRESERRCRETLENAPLAVVWLDREGRITFCNRALLRLIGRDRDNVVGCDWFATCVAAEAQANRRAHYQQSLKTGQIADSDQTEVLTGAGERRLIGWSNTLLRSPDGQIVGLSSLGQDITERTRAEAALRESEERFRTLMALAPVGIFRTDAAGNCRFVNGHWCKMTSQSPGEATGPIWGPEVHPDDRGRILQAWDESVVANAPFAADLRFRSADGQVIWADVLAVPMAEGYLGTATDVTQRKMAEEALRAGEERLRLAADATGLGTFDSDLRLDTIRWDDRVREMFGLQPSEAESREVFYERVHPDDRDLARRKIAAAQDPNGDGSYHAEYRVIRPDGEVHWLNAHGRVLFEAQGDQRTAYRFVGTVLDVTDRHLLEQQFHQAQKMEAVGRLAGGIAHDFNNLLTVINGFAELVLDNMPVRDPQSESLREVVRAGTRAAELTGQLLAFSRKSLLAPKVLDLNALLSEMHRMLARLIGEDVHLMYIPNPDLGLIKADRSRLEQVVVNLVVNARDAMPSGGRLTLATANVLLDESYTDGRDEVSPGRYVMLSVTDTGCGMTPEIKARVFEPFFTTKEVGKGTGLGLATVYGIVKQSGGHVEVESETGRGTMFKIYLPRHDEPAPLSAVEDSAIPGGSESILVVEDEPAVRRLAREALTARGYVVQEAADGEEALRLVEQHHGPLDLLLTDVVMPRMGGRELAEAVIERFPSTRVLFMSGYTDDAVVRQGLLKSGAAFVQKPFTLTRLLHRVREVLDVKIGE
jgi:PAS domain S-box-containing protein